MLDSFNNRNIINFSDKATSSLDIDKINQVVLDRISENMAALEKMGNCDAINTIDTPKMGYYVIKLFSEAYTLQEDTTCNGKISASVELFFKAQYIKCIQDNTKWYWEQTQKKNHCSNTHNFTSMYGCNGSN